MSVPAATVFPIPILSSIIKFPPEKYAFPLTSRQYPAEANSRFPTLIALFTTVLLVSNVILFPII